MSESLKHGVVQVFAKAPTPGHAKTRLIPILGEKGASRLHAALVRDTLSRLTTELTLPVQLWCAPDAEDPFFQACGTDFPVALQAQSGDDLGARMMHALDTALADHHCAILVGCDCPDLQASDIHAATDALHNGHDVVLGPAEDGGYYLIGVRRPLPQLFDQMPWGGDQVMAQTESRLAADDLSWLRLTTRRDLDRPEDLIHFPSLNIHLNQR